MVDLYQVAKGGDVNNPTKRSEIFHSIEWANIPYTGIHNDGLTKGWDHSTGDQSTAKNNGFVKNTETQNDNMKLLN